MKKNKIMMFTLIILLIAVIVETSIICIQKKDNSKEKGNDISKTNIMVNESIAEENVVEDTSSIINVVEENTLASVENVIPEEKAIVYEEKSTPSVKPNVESKKEDNNQEKKEELQTVVAKTKSSVHIEQPVVQPVVTTSQVEIPVPTVNVSVQPEEPVNPPSTAKSEEYRYNDSMTQTIVSIINNNPSQYMVQDGFSVVVDSSITSLTNQFTFSEQRVINKISMKAGTIKVYAQDYYLNGEFLFTECYIF